MAQAMTPATLEVKAWRVDKVLSPPPTVETIAVAVVVAEYICSRAVLLSQAVPSSPSHDSILLTYLTNSLSYRLSQ